MSNVVDIPWKGEELKNLGTDRGSRGSGQKFIGVHLEDVNQSEGVAVN
jgi:hypothetical protein